MTHLLVCQLHQCLEVLLKFLYCIAHGDREAAIQEEKVEKQHFCFQESHV